MPDQGSFSPLPLEGADERSEAGLASPRVEIPLREPTSAPSGHLLPKKGGSVPPSLIVISSESEKSFSFAVKKGCEERDHGKHRTPNDFIPLQEPTSAPLGHLLPKEGGRKVECVYKMRRSHHHFVFLIRAELSSPIKRQHVPRAYLISFDSSLWQ